jgi:sulfoxide reductase heme-binding subunit YedZ
MPVAGRLPPFAPARVLVHFACLAPGVWLVADTALGRLSANPIADLTTRTGRPALALLTACLAITPLGTITGRRWLGRFRRTLGLYAFGYALAHITVFAVVDYGLDPALLREAILEKPYALAGMAALATLAPLAATSTRGWQRRLGRRWKALHRGIYVAALLAVVHYGWLVKSDYRQPAAWGAAIAALLALRLPRARAYFARRRSGPARNVTPDPSPAVEVQRQV